MFWYFKGCGDHVIYHYKKKRRKKGFFLPLYFPLTHFLPVNNVINDTFPAIQHNW